MRTNARPDKPLVWLRGEIKTPPFGAGARVQAGFLLRRLQRGERLAMPESRPMPGTGPACHELRLRDGKVNWRIMCHVAADAIVILEVLVKKTATTPGHVFDECRTRLAAFQKASGRKGPDRAG
jgi:phage-related protein